MEWTLVAIYASIVVVGAAGLPLLHSLVGPSNARPGKLDPYECGVPQQSATRERFSVKFYLVAIMFILFDIETVFLLPWAMMYKELGVTGLVEFAIFFAVLGLGLGWLWKRGGLEWD